ncbi:hypothetical protein NQ318_008476 [Aromia moschata]|uniref:Eukaryotic translation initiation factor 2 subunit 1 n=1 Tax=Aromia moschata TaxID=1265417 RepID=A0AAV8YAQ6_9CUCU|nr:hypothetical protein NQ318_008476 [Aromia moschata]
MPLSCRFYKEKYPEVEDVVMVNVRAIAEMGAYVHLLEYNNIEGMILLSELSRRRIRSINKLIRVGKTEPVVVIRVDKEKGYIDLSKRRVSAEDVEKCTERFAKAKAVNSILRHVAELLKYESDEQLEELYQKTAWHFEEKYKKNKASAYDFFKQAVLKETCLVVAFEHNTLLFIYIIGSAYNEHAGAKTMCPLYANVCHKLISVQYLRDPSILAECGLDENTKEVLLGNIKRKLTSQAVKIRADIECACYGYEGIDAVKTALKAGLSLSTDELPIKINLIAPPLYVMTTSTPEKQDGLKILNDAIEQIKTSITTLGGVFNIQMAPKVVTATDEAELVKQMERAELENAEVAGDDDDEEEQEEGQVYSEGEDDEKGVSENGDL